MKCCPPVDAHNTKYRHKKLTELVCDKPEPRRTVSSLKTKACPMANPINSYES
jgi:hypothetical protein